MRSGLLPRWIARCTMVWVAAAALLTPLTARASQPPSCPPVEGLAPLLEPGAISLFGEMHGTAEAPTLFGDIVCGMLAAGRSVTVGLELPGDEAAALTAYLDSEGSPEDRAALLSRDLWQNPYQDGRTSVAMIGLIESLRQMRHAGKRLEVILFDLATPASSSQERDRAMADRLQAAIEASSSDLFVVLTGNVHSRMSRGTPWDEGYEPMAYLASKSLPARRWISLNLASAGGTAWICTSGEASDCKARPIRGRSQERPRGIELSKELQDQPYHGTYYVGALTASRPAVRPTENEPGS